MALNEIILDQVPVSLTFRPIFPSSKPSHGRIPHNVGSPYWVFEYNFNPMKLDPATEFESLLDEGEGIHVFSLYDPARLFPKQHRAAIEGGASESVVQAVTVKGMTRATRSWTINMPVGETITRGDPLAFLDTARGRRIYARALETLNGTGADQTLTVNVRPRYTVSGLNETAERIRPRCWFDVDVNAGERSVGVALEHRYSLSGIEHFGPL